MKRCGDLPHDRDPFVAQDVLVIEPENWELSAMDLSVHIEANRIIRPSTRLSKLDEAVPQQAFRHVAEHSVAQFHARSSCRVRK